MTKQVFVIMGNDYPDAVFSTEEAADTYIAERKKETHDQHGQRRLIHWRWYNFVVDAEQ